MQRVGRVAELWRYPVKGMAGERVASLPLGPLGLAGDRLWALRDSARGEIQSCKFRPQLLRCRASLRDGEVPRPGAAVDIHFADGSVLGSDDPHIHAQLSALVGHPSTLEALRPAGDEVFYRRYRPDAVSWRRELEATFEREPGEPLPDFSRMPVAAQTYVCAPGSFFLVAPLHLLTTATLSQLQTLCPASDCDRQRFRPNVVIATDEPAGFVEQAWVGSRLQLGAVTVDCTETAPRCGAVTRPQATLQSDTALLRTIVRHADQNAGIYAIAQTHANLREGDVVWRL